MLHYILNINSGDLTKRHWAGKLSHFFLAISVGLMKYITFPFKPAPFLAPVRHGGSKDTGEGVWNQKHFPKKLLPLLVVVAQSWSIASSRVTRTPLRGNLGGSGDIQHLSHTHANIWKNGCLLNVYCTAGGGKGSFGASRRVMEGEEVPAGAGKPSREGFVSLPLWSPLVQKMAWERFDKTRCTKNLFEKKFYNISWFAFSSCNKEN